MKKNIFYVVCLLFLVLKTHAQLIGGGYGFTNTSITYSAIAGTNVHAAGVDDAISGSVTIPFTFQYGCVGRTAVRISSNGWLTFNTGLATAYNVNDLDNASNAITNPLIVAPLWDDLEVTNQSGTANDGVVRYQTLGTTPTRTFVVEWSKMEWDYGAGNSSMSFQVRLCETTNNIEFWYKQEATATATVSAGGASIGLMGATTGDFISINTTPAASSVTETDNIATKPANNSVYRFTPINCSGTPSAGTAANNPTGNCSSFTTTLSMSGSSTGCGITYQWQSAPTAVGAFTNIGSALTAPTLTYAVTANTYFRCIVTCASSGLSATSNTISAVIASSLAASGSYSVSLPYSIAGQTTCGMLNDITPTNVANVCGSVNYYDGEDVVYIFTPTATTTLNAAVTSSGTYVGMTLYRGCPTGTGVCVANSQSTGGNQDLGCAATVSLGTTYYLVIDSWPSPACNPYNLNMSLNTCVAAPAAGNASASPAIKCGAFTTTLSVTGSSSQCGLTYQWQSATAAAGPFTNIASATAITATTSVPASSVRYYRCLVSCGVFTGTSSVVSATAIPTGTCGCEYSLTSLPFVATNQTTCGQVDDLKTTGAGSVTSVCGSANYYTGEDVLYGFTPATTGQVSIALASSGSYTGLMLYQGCPTSAGAVCVANIQDSNGPKNLCVPVTGGTKYYLILDSYASPACNPYDLSISAPLSTASQTCNMAYTSATTTYSFESFTGTTLPTTDDILFNSIINFGFPVCYDGAQYWGGYVASNSSFVFDAVPCYPNIQTNIYAAGGVATDYEITTPAPTATTSIPRNAVLAPWHDVNPSLGGTIRYATFGTAPTRRCVISWENIPMYSCGTASPTIYHTSQVKLYETTNVIEIHIGQKRVCPGWNDGGAVMGLMNYNGTIYVPPVNATAHNVNAALTYTWAMTNTAYRFTTVCGQSAGTCLVLPVGLTSFYAERVDKANHIYWETSNEENIGYYVIQRSTDAVNFTDIGTVASNNKPSKYHFEDRNAAPGIVNYYRVAIHEKNNFVSHTYVYPLGSGENEVLNVSQIYPNPANTVFTIAFDSKQHGQAIINVYDLFGKLVRSSPHNVETGITQTTVAIEDLTPGIYYVEVVNNLNEPITKQKLVKQ